MDHQDWQSIAWKKTPPVTKPRIKHNPLDTDDPPPPPLIAFNTRDMIQKARMAKGITQRQLASKLNVTPITINGYESGKIIPEKPVLRKICQTLGIKLPK